MSAKVLADGVSEPAQKCYYIFRQAGEKEMKFKFLICCMLGCMISSNALSANCCSISGKTCLTARNCTAGEGTCGPCTGSTIDPVDPVDPVDPTPECVSPYVLDSTTNTCVCPQLAGALSLEPACENGKWDATICTCSCNSGYYQQGDACNPCPNSGNSSAGSTSVTNCYLSTFSDTAGTGSYSPPCYYTN